MVRRRFFSAVSNHEFRNLILRDARKSTLLGMRGALIALRKPNDMRNIAPDRRQFYKKQKTFGRLKCAPTACRAG